MLQSAQLSDVRDQRSKSDMFILLAIWIAAFLLITGVGLGARSIFRQPSKPAEAVFSSFWIGFALVLGFLQILHFFLPIQPLGMIAIVLFSGAGWLYSAKTVWMEWRSTFRSNILPLALWLGLGLVCVVFAMRPVGWNDTARYHLGLVKWATEYAIVPGLANLYAGYGSSGTYFLYGALFNFGPLYEKTYLLANGLLAWVLLGQSLLALKRIFRDGIATPGTVFGGLLLAPALLELYTTQFTSLSPDSGLFYLELAVAMELVRVLSRSTSCRERTSAAWMIILLSCAGVAVKQSLLVFGLCAVGVSFFVILQSAENRAAKVRTALIALGAFIGIVFPSVLRAGILSGYLGYPSTIGALPVEWRVPSDQVEAYQKSLIVRARYPAIPNAEEVQVPAAWFDTWFESLPPQIISIAVMSGLVALFLLIAFQWKKRKDADWGLCLVPAIALFSLLFWFGSVPALRFAGSFFWILLIGLIVMGWEYLNRTFTGLTAWFAFVLVVVFAIWVSPFQGVPSLRLSQLIYLPEAPAQPVFSDKPLSATISLHVIKDMDFCWNSPLPCSSYSQAGLQLLDPENLQKGFRQVSVP